jgi:hypothetical protein
MARGWLKACAIEAFRRAGITWDADQSVYGGQQRLDLTSWAGRFHPNHAHRPRVGNPVSRAVHLSTMETWWRAHDVSGTGRQISGRAMQPITTMMPVRQCGHSRNDCPVSTS